MEICDGKHIQTTVIYLIYKGSDEENGTRYEKGTIVSLYF